MKVTITAILIAFLATSCEYFQQKVETEKVIVAQANDAVLYLDDLNGITPLGLGDEDSTKLVEAFVQNWIKKQVLISRAIQETQFDQEEIDRKVLDYRYSLIIHEFEKNYVQSNLNPDITDAEIEAYYQEKSDNFLLKQNILRCLFAKVPKGSPGIENFRRNIRGYPNASLDDIKSYCFQYANSAFTDEDIWINFNEVATASPLKEVKNQVQFLQSSTYNETSDDDFIYFLRILEYKISDEMSPLEFIRDDIESILVNKRKIELKRELEEAIYEEAKKNESFKIYSR